MPAAVNPLGRDTLLAALSGVLYAGALPGFDLWPLAFVCWVPLLLALHRRDGWRAAWLGLAHGVAMSLVATPWLFGLVRTFSGWGWGASAPLALLLCLYQSGRCAVLAWLTARAVRRGWPLGLSFCLALAAVEVAYPLLFGWQSAIQIHTVPLLMQAAELGGPILISVALAGANVAGAELLRARLDRRRLDVRRLALAGLGPALLVAYGALRLPIIDQRIAQAPKARIGVVQANLGLRGVRAANSAKAHRDATVELAAHGRLELVIWPETAIHSVYTDRDLPSALSALLSGEGGAAEPLPSILTGIMVRGTDAAGQLEEPANSAVLIQPEAGVTGRYDKNRLVPLGEYVPFGDRWPILYQWFPNSGPLTPGKAPSTVLLGGHRLGVLICYEDIFPDYANAMARQGHPDVLINLTNDGWFGQTAAVTMHFALSKFRAVEHRRALVRASNTGISAFIDPAGRVTGQLQPFVAATGTGEIAWMQGSTGYELLGDAPWWASAVAILAMGWIRLGKDSAGSPGPV